MKGRKKHYYTWRYDRMHPFLQVMVTIAIATALILITIEVAKVLTIAVETIGG